MDWSPGIGAAEHRLPLVAQNFPAFTTHPALIARTTDAQGRPVPVYFEDVVRLRAEDPTSPLEGRGWLHTELILLRGVGVDATRLSPGGRLAGRFPVDALLPILLLRAERRVKPRIIHRTH